MNERSGAVSNMPPDPSILIVLMGSIGDVTRGLALVAPLKSAFPGGKISWLVEPKSEGLVRCHGLIDEVIVFRRDKGLRGAVDAVRQIQGRHFDVTLDLQRHLKSGVLSWVSRAPLRVGFNRRNAKELNWLFSNRQIRYYQDSTPKILLYLEFLSALGLAVPHALDFGLGARRCKSAQPRLAMVLSSSWPTKDWPLEGYDRLLTALFESHPDLEIVLLGDKKRAAEAEKLCRKYQKPGLINLAAKTSIGQLVDELGRCWAAVGPDSGPGHIAAALGVPYVSLFGPTSPERTAPYGAEDLVLRSEIGCAPCCRKRCPGLDTMCMRLISPERVVERILSVLG